MDLNATNRRSWSCDYLLSWNCRPEEASTRSIEALATAAVGPPRGRPVPPEPCSTPGLGIRAAKDRPTSKWRWATIPDSAAIPTDPDPGVRPSLDEPIGSGIGQSPTFAVLPDQAGPPVATCSTPSSRFSKRPGQGRRSGRRSVGCRADRPGSVFRRASTSGSWWPKITRSTARSSCRMLERMGCIGRVSSTTAEQAIRARERGEHDLILMDVQMPVPGRPGRPPREIRRIEEREWPAAES